MVDWRPGVYRKTRLAHDCTLCTWLSSHCGGGDSSPRSLTECQYGPPGFAEGYDPVRFIGGSVRNDGTGLTAWVPSFFKNTIKTLDK